MKKWVVGGALCMIAGLAVIYYFFDPAQAGWMPRCLWKVATGTDCPGCGSQRMIHALMHGDFASAWKANAFALCMLPAIVFMLWLEAVRGRHSRLYACVHRPGVIVCFGVVVMGWWILRNVAW